MAKGTVMRYRRTLLLVTITISFIVAMMLEIFPWPGVVKWLAPQWLVLVLIYWLLAMPYRISISLAWILGILLDLLHNTLLGEHAVALVFVAYFITKFHIRIRLFTIWRQSFMVFITVLMYLALLFWTQGLLGELPASLLYWLSSITSAVFWPLILVICEKLSHETIFV